MQTNIIAKCNSSSRERPRCGQKETETTTEQLKEKQKKQNRNTGYPALDPTTNKYISGSGWETMYMLLFFCFVIYVFLEAFSVLSVVICVCSIVNAKT